MLTFYPVTSIGEFVSGPGQLNATFLPNPEWPRVLQEYFINVAVSQFTDSFDFLRGQGWAEKLVVLMLQNSKGYGDDNIIGGKFFTVATLHYCSRARITYGAPSYAAHWLAISIATDNTILCN